MTNENTTCSSCQAWKETIRCVFYFGIGFLYGVKCTEAYYERKEGKKEDEEKEGKKEDEEKEEE